MSWIINNIYSDSSNFFNYFSNRGQSPVATQPNSNIDYMKIVPADVWLHIFSMIPPHEMGPIRCVCREFRRLGSEEILGGIPALQKFYPKINVIGPEVWIKYDLFWPPTKSFVEIDPIGAYQPTTRALGEAIGSFYNQVEGDVGATVFTLPKGLTLNRLLTIARVFGVPIYRSFEERGLRRIGDEEVTATCIQVISNSVLKDSRNRRFFEQQALCRQLRCEVPAEVTSLAFIVLSYLESAKPESSRFFGILRTKDVTYTQSPPRKLPPPGEGIGSSNQVAIGLIAGRAMSPRLSIHDYASYDACHGNEQIGVLALRKF